jgi:hypothetical protein
VSYDHWAHRRDPDLDALEEDEPSGTPPGDPGRPQLPAGASRYGWFVGVVGILVLAWITLNTLRTDAIQSGVKVGTKLPPFAVPLLASDLDGDANLALKAGKGAGSSGHVTACEVRDPRALVLCRFARGRPVVLVFASIEDGGSRQELDTVARVRKRFPGVGFAGIMLRGNRGDAKRAARERGWDFPLGYDRHADVAAAYGVKSLPAIVFADDRRRIAAPTVYRKLTGPQLAARVRRLQAG